MTCTGREQLPLAFLTTSPAPFNFVSKNGRMRSLDKSGSCVSVLGTVDRCHRTID